MKKKCESGEFFHSPIIKLLFIMKFILILICTTGLLASFGKSYSQTNNLSLDFKRTSIESVLNYIESNTEFSFMYDNKKIDIRREVDINVKNKTIENILDQLFENKAVYQIIGKHIIITPKESQSNFNNQQQKSITGKVVDLSGAPLPGVSVVV